MQPSKVGSLLARDASKTRVASQAQKISSSLAGEYALALLWPLSTITYALLPPLVATVLGALVLWPLACFVVHYACPRKMPPRVSPAFILVDCFYLEPPLNVREDVDRERRRARDDAILKRVESPFLGLVRLLLHWLGTFSGYWLLKEAYGPAFRLRVEEGLHVVWGQLGSVFAFSNGGLYVFAVHVLVQALVALYQMRFFAAIAHSEDDDESGKDSRVRTGAYKGPLVASLVYPWAAPHFSPGSFLWVTHAIGLSSLTLMTATLASCAVSAVLTVFLYEGTLGRTATATATTTTASTTATASTSVRKKFIQRKEDTPSPPSQHQRPSQPRKETAERTDTEINELD